MDPVLPAAFGWFPWRIRRAPSKNAEAYGDSPSIESLNATVLVEFPLSKGPISLRFPAPGASAAISKNSIKSKIKPVQPSALIHARWIKWKRPSRVIAPSPIDARLTGPLPARQRPVLFRAATEAMDEVAIAPYKSPMRGD
jgi:hypothetical protein